jgi:hypothetical protein
MLSTIPSATAAPVLYAVEPGWIELKGVHSASLTEEGTTVTWRRCGVLCSSAEITFERRET